MRSLRALLLIVFALCAVPQAAIAYYNPSTGRWLSRDPMGEGGPARTLAASNQFLPRDATVGPNNYAFVENNPVGAIDPFGLFMSGVHKSLTRYAVNHSTVQLAQGCRDKVADILVKANTGQDSGAAFDMMERHFNRPYAVVESAKQVATARRTWDAKYIAYLQSEESAFTTALGASDCKGALEALGRVTHSWTGFLRARDFQRISSRFTIL